MKGHYRLTPAAAASFESLGEHTEEKWGVAQRDKYLDALVRRFIELAHSPLVGRSREELRRGLRSYREGHHVIFYKVESNKNIVIIDILHEKMDPALHLTPRA